ncbi:acetyl-CoA C-acetyltransferase [Micrococcales bacterium 31B]|nr:acetyl-CoA C-acetyltransferase [Micrococcales bacterium 31B]
MMTIKRAAILGGNRIPFARAGGRYAHVGNQDMLTAALDGLIARFGLSGELLGEVVAGAVLKHSRDFNLTREVVLGSALDPRTPAHDLTLACATGLEAIVGSANKIKLGMIDSAIAGGSDSASDAPIALSEGARRALLDAQRARTTAGKLKALAGLRPQDAIPAAPNNGEPRTGMSMGQHQALTNLAWNITRMEQDEIAVRSHRNLAAAYQDGFFDDLMTGYLGLARDENLRPDSSVEKLAGLKTVFGKRETATMTAGNSTPLSDGASAVLLASDEWADAHNLAPLAYLVDAHDAAVDFVQGRDGLLTAPIFGLAPLLQRNGLTFDDIDRFEIHEAFAGVVATTVKAWADAEFCRERLGLDGALGVVPVEKLNVRGSSLAAGHPFAATGGRIVASLAKDLSARAAETGRKQRGLVSICAAGGQGVLAILESA